MAATVALLLAALSQVGFVFTIQLLFPGMGYLFRRESAILCMWLDAFEGFRQVTEQRGSHRKGWWFCAHSRHIWLFPYVIFTLATGNLSCPS